MEKPTINTVLTEDQKTKIPDYLEKYMKIGLSTDPTDRKKAEAAFKNLYLRSKESEPEVRWFQSPFEAVFEAAKESTGKEQPTQEEIIDEVSKASFPQFESYWVATSAFLAYETNIKHDGLIDIAQALVEEVSVYWAFEGLVIACDKPTAIHLENGRLHNPDGLALEFADGNGICALEGKRYPSLIDLEIANHLKK